jgi:hypothetical protein
MTEETRPRRYTAQLVILEEPDIAGEIRAWAEVNGQQLAPILRELLRAGLREKRKAWVREHGALETAYLAAHVASAIK